MSDAPATLGSLDLLEGELVRVIRGYPRRILRRRLAALAAITLAVPAGYAGARELIGVAEPPPVVIRADDVVTVGFQDPVTGEPVRCPDGALLTQTLSGIDVSGARSAPDPTCSDGSIPEVYLISKQQQDDFIKNAPFGTDLSEAPGLKAFVIERDNGGR